MDDAFYKRFARSFSNDALNLILMPTEKCNFRCDYCYERFDKGRMSSTIVEGVKELISRRAPKLSLLDISWFGGEPTLCPDIIDEVSCQALAVKELYGLDYRANMTTNGYLLTRPRLEKFVELGVVQYQITLDGYAQDHDLTRKKINGTGTFSTIWKNLLAFRSSDRDFIVVLRIHFLRNNWQEKRELIDIIKNEFSHDPRFRIHIIGLSNFGGPNDQKLAFAAGREKKEMRLRLLKDVPDQMQKIPDVEYTNYVCYASKGNSFVVRSDGRISKCTVGLYDDRNIVGSIGRDGLLMIDDKKLRPWFAGFMQKDRATLACPANSVLWGKQ